MKYAEVIVDISTQALDHIFTYAIPDELADSVSVGCQVEIPFGRGNRERKGYVMCIKENPDYDASRIKPVSRVICDASVVEGQLLSLAGWMKEQYGSTLVQALSTVLPLKAKVRPLQRKDIALQIDREEAQPLLVQWEKRHYKAKVRLLRALLAQPQLTRAMVTGGLQISSATLQSMLQDGVIRETTQRVYRNPHTELGLPQQAHVLNAEQEQAYRSFCRDYDAGIHRTYLLYGVTGSGKTEVYLHMIERVLRQGREAIVLIPEIALTYQTVRRFASRFGDLVTVIHSRLSKGERYDQFERARRGEVRIVIGPRSALFVPFSKLGLIILDEEHEASYKSESPPKYHARETAIERARLAGASVVLGSATPSVESYTRAQNGEYGLLRLSQRAAHATLPQVQVVDMRKEIQARHFSMFSRELLQALSECLSRKEQSMLFINRRGYAGFVSCRNCGYVAKCPHCDVSLKLHNNRLLRCHYCGYHTPVPERCPECGSRYIRAFGTGTQKVEEQLQKQFPSARILRMDADTTRHKGDHERILAAFADAKADILVGTQMIVKGHDFPEVTLVAALAADLSLFEQDFRSSERTFDLLTQAAGRAGRGEKAGRMLIQTYQPEQYSITAAAQQDYEAFYQQESAYRKLLHYPPYAHLLAVFMASEQEEPLGKMAQRLAALCGTFSDDRLQCIGPSEASVYRVQDVYRRLLYLKHPEYAALVEYKNQIENYLKTCKEGKVRVYFDFDPMNMY